MLPPPQGRALRVIRAAAAFLSRPPPEAGLSGRNDRALNEGEIAGGAHHPGADGFKMAEPSLQLLGHGVDVAEAAFQRMVVKDRGGARGTIGEVDRLARLGNG